MPKRMVLTVLAVMLASLVALVPATAQQGSPDLGPAFAAQQGHTPELMARSGVEGTAVGLSTTGQPAVLVFTEGPGVAGLPRSLDGIPVAIHVTGRITALGHRPGHQAPGGGGTGVKDPKPTDRWPRPVPIGISTGNAGECSAGTIGARVKSGSSVYALSNNHVYALQNTAPLGSQILQPGRYDTGCAADTANNLGTLAAFVPITFSTTANNTVDAATALSAPEDLGRATPANGYGTPTSGTVAAALNQAVQKYGRTTALTRGQVVGLNAIVNVGYSAGTARFVDQIVILGNKPFLRSGDSGSLVVTDPGKNPVGLAFASSANGYAFANPIDLVLSALGVTVDGG